MELALIVRIVVARVLRQVLNLLALIYFSFKDLLFFTESLAVMLNRLLAEGHLRRFTRKSVMMKLAFLKFL